MEFRIFTAMKHFSPFAFLLLLITATLITSCAGSSATMCERDGAYSKNKKFKNKSNYSTRYRMKAKPVSKDYVIRNKKSSRIP
jgi:hypothetical protein